jgi:hypothetical protein
MILQSLVPGYTGQCRPVWINTNQVHNRLDRGRTGFFRLVKRTPWLLGLRVKTGPEFHGIVQDGCVQSTGEPQ